MAKKTCSECRWLKKDRQSVTGHRCAAPLPFWVSVDTVIGAEEWDVQPNYEANTCDMFQPKEGDNKENMR